MAASLLKGKLVLVVDDDPYSLAGTSKILELEGVKVIQAIHGNDALKKLEHQKIDAILSDIRMPELSGLELLERLVKQRSISPRPAMILMTAFGRIEDAVGAMKLGAVDFLIKPFGRKALVNALESVFARVSVSSTQNAKPFVCHSILMKDLMNKVNLISNTQSNVMLYGESGTGKEQVARLIHQKSIENQQVKNNAPFIAVNCASIPENLIEAELFGVIRGAYTGADQTRMGLVEKANGGTLLLDEIGDMPLATQVALLRFLQESEIRPVGAIESKRVRVRCIASTHRNIRNLVQEGRFREDLMYRLEVIQLTIPPLRERKEDILPMAELFLSREIKKMKGESTAVPVFNAESKNLLQNYFWPGNVRELENLMERLAVFSTESIIQKEHFPEHLQELIKVRSYFENRGDEIIVRPGTPLREVEDLLIRKTLDLTDGDKSKAAKLLGVNTRTIYRKLDRELEKELE